MNYLTLLVLVYADYAVVLSDGLEEINQILVVLITYSNEWKQKLCCNETKVVEFIRRRSNLSNFVFVFSSESTEVVNYCRYLWQVPQMWAGT